MFLGIKYYSHVKKLLNNNNVYAVLSYNGGPGAVQGWVQKYETKDFDVYHFDLYRLKSPEEIFELGMEEAMYDGVCLIEWPEKMGGYLPKKSIIINIKHQPEGREIRSILKMGRQMPVHFS